MEIKHIFLIAIQRNKREKKNTQMFDYNFFLLRNKLLCKKEKLVVMLSAHFFLSFFSVFISFSELISWVRSQNTVNILFT
jgi:hypothetical protein